MADPEGLGEPQRWQLGSRAEGQQADVVFIRDHSDCQPPRPIAVVLFHGIDDQQVPYTGRPPPL